MLNIRRDPNEDQISNWKTEPRDCTDVEENIKKKETEPNTKQYSEATQMFYCLSKRHYRGIERENISSP